MLSSSSSRLGMSLLSMVLTCACSGEEDHPAGLESCVGELCNPGGGSSTTPKDAGSDALVEADVQVEVANLSGDIVRMIDQDFSETQVYTGWGYVRVPTLSSDAEVLFGGDAGPGYSAEGVIVGDGWFTVVPDAVLLDQVMPTYAYLRVPEGGSTTFGIPVVDKQVLSTIYSGFFPSMAVRGDAAQVIVIFERAGQRVSGVRLAAFPTAEALAFNPGTAYTTQATETGLNGVALMVNVIGTGPMKWIADGGEETSLTVVHVPGQASLVRVEVPEG